MFIQCCLYVKLQLTFKLKNIRIILTWLFSLLDCVYPSKTKNNFRRNSSSTRLKNYCSINRPKPRRNDEKKLIAFVYVSRLLVFYFIIFFFLCVFFFGYCSTTPHVSIPFRSFPFACLLLPQSFRVRMNQIVYCWKTTAISHAIRRRTIPIGIKLIYCIHIRLFTRGYAYVYI